jgi:4-hydroxybenzoate polyprenyltransferase
MKSVLEQDHRFIKKRIAATLWFRSVGCALNRIASYEFDAHDPERTSPLVREW